MQKKLEFKDVSGSPDARLWAQFFLETCKEHPNVPGNFESMVGWFSNAIMAGYDEACRIYNKNK